MIGVTRLSTKGQIVIPEEIRIAAKLKPGDKFVVRIKSGKIVLEKVKL